MRHVAIRRYEVSAILLVLAVLVVSVAIVTAAFFWASKTIPFSVEEPLSVTSFPAEFTAHPGENKTLDITIVNSANVDYSVMLVLTLNDTVFQQSYVEFSNYTYLVSPGLNQIQGWLSVDKKSPPTALELTMEFHRE